MRHTGNGCLELDAKEASNLHWCVGFIQGVIGEDFADSDAVKVKDLIPLRDQLQEIVKKDGA